MSPVGFPQIMDLEYETTWRTARSTHTWATDMTKGLYALNSVGFGAVKGAENYPNIKPHIVSCQAESSRGIDIRNSCFR